MLNKLIAILIITMFSNAAVAQTATSSGSFSLISKGQPSLFDGIVFDDVAVGTILADREFLIKLSDERLHLELEKLELSKNFEIEGLKLTIDTNKKISDQTIQTQQDIINELSDPPFPWLPVLGVGGIALTLGIVSGILLTKI